MYWDWGLGTVLENEKDFVFEIHQSYDNPFLFMYYVEHEY